MRECGLHSFEDAPTGGGREGKTVHVDIASGGRVGLVSLRQVTLELTFFVVVMATLLAAIVPAVILFFSESGASGHGRSHRRTCGQPRNPVSLLLSAGADRDEHGSGCSSGRPDAANQAGSK